MSDVTEPVSEDRVYYADNGPSDCGTVLDVPGTRLYRISWDSDEPGSTPDTYTGDQLVMLR